MLTFARVPAVTPEGLAPPSTLCQAGDFVPIRNSFEARMSDDSHPAGEFDSNPRGGRFLENGGDMVRRFQGNQPACPQNMWSVDQSLFESPYRQVDPRDGA